MTFKDFKERLRKNNYVAYVDDYTMLAVKHGDQSAPDIHIRLCDNSGHVYGKLIATVRGDMVDCFEVFSSMSDDVLLLVSHFATTPPEQRFSKES